MLIYLADVVLVQHLACFGQTSFVFFLFLEQVLLNLRHRGFESAELITVEQLVVGLLVLVRGLFWNQWLADPDLVHF